MTIPIQTVRHHEYTTDSINYLKWRLAYRGGIDFINHYLEKFSNRETQDDFDFRKSIAFSPSFAKAAINEFKDAIFDRLIDVKRLGGSDSYQSAMRGDNFGVDLRGNSMNTFVGKFILPELLPMKQVGVYVDYPNIASDDIFQNSLYNVKTNNLRPYLYVYFVEDILSWTFYQDYYRSVLLRDYQEVVDPETGLIIGERVRYRHLWINELTGKVNARFYDESISNASGKPEIVYLPGDVIELNLTRIPFVCFKLQRSLMEDVADYQIALLNLASSDLLYALKANFPFYTEQFRSVEELAKFAKKPNEDSPGTQGTSEIKVGIRAGRRYPQGVERPGFIHPSSEPLRASMDLEEKLKKEIRQLINLSVSSLDPTMASAESKSFDVRGLESGLSVIGSEVERGEREIATYWAMYEKGNSVLFTFDDVATVNYPEKYSMRSEEDRRKEAKEWNELSSKVPSVTFKREVAKQVVDTMMGHRLSTEMIETIRSEIDKAPIIQGDPEIITRHVEAGFLDKESAAQSQNYPDYVVEKANEEHAERLKIISESQAKPQTTINNNGQGARGNPDASPDPKDESRQEKEGKDQRGDGKNLNKEVNNE